MCNNQLAVVASAASAHAERRAAAPTIGDIFRQYGPAYRAKFGDRMSRDQLRVMKSLERCRTGELGAALYRCDACGRDHVVPQSCGNRHCPIRKAGGGRPEQGGQELRKERIKPFSTLQVSTAASASTLLA